MADVHVWIHNVIVRITVSHFNFGKSYTLEIKQNHGDTVILPNQIHRQSAHASVAHTQQTRFYSTLQELILHSTTNWVFIPVSILCFFYSCINAHSVFLSSLAMVTTHNVFDIFSFLKVAYHSTINYGFADLPINIYSLYRWCFKAENQMSVFHG